MMPAPVAALGTGHVRGTPMPLLYRCWEEDDLSRRIKLVEVHLLS